MIQNILSTILSAIKKNIKNFFLYIFLTALLLVLLFPYSDLSDYVTSMVAKNTKNQVFMRMDGIGFSLIPAPSLKLENLVVEAAKMPSIKTPLLKISPHYLKLITTKLGASVYSPDFYGSELDLSFSQTDKIESERKAGQKSAPNPLMDYKMQTQLELVNLSLKSFSKAFKIPVGLDGDLSAYVDASIDPSFSTQPNGEFNMNSQGLTVESPTIKLAIGEITLPDLQFSQMSVKGRVVESELVIEELNLGVMEDPISVKLKGKISMEITQRRNKITPKFSRYEARTQINVNNSLISQLYFLSFLDGQKVSPIKNGYSTYQFKVTGRNPRDFTNMTRLTTFQ